MLWLELFLTVLSALLLWGASYGSTPSIRWAARLVGACGLLAAFVFAAS